ncbi:unnamed protein product [Symbiodinium sp. CCMP2592]|nr:unnamed protein product [Symbiodinium sp. CCMP2592]
MSDALVARIEKLEDVVSDWAAVTRTRWIGMCAWENRLQELLSRKEPLWHVKTELYVLALEDLEPILASIQDTAVQMQCRAELRECLSAVDDVVGIFPVGGGWGHHTGVDLRHCPSMSALRMSQLVRHHLRGAASAFSTNGIEVWAPLSQSDMKKKRNRQGGKGGGGKGHSKGAGGEGGGRCRDCGRERERSRDHRRSPGRRSGGPPPTFQLWICLRGIFHFA